MNSFLVGLQFLTRIRIVRQTVWTAEDFGRSTRFFPLVGLVLGICYALAAWILISVLGMRAASLNGRSPCGRLYGYGGWCVLGARTRAQA